jgi:NAD(P)-dependent dehydrogenase (short-subunit alcohol dehydrogenase family)
LTLEQVSTNIVLEVVNPSMLRIILITGGAKRIGRHISISLAKAGYDIALMHGHSDDEADQVSDEIKSFGRKCYLFKMDLDESRTIDAHLASIPEDIKFTGLINNAAVFKPLSFETTTLDDWERHLRINLTAPFLLSKWFHERLNPDSVGRIINILDWRALRPGDDHFPYTISKAALAAMTKSLAVSLAPRVMVNGIAFGAILPPSDGSPAEKMLLNVPLQRTANLEEVTQTIRFLLEGPGYITGEIIHLDGGRHLI